jgi:hypothetical protein
MEGRREEEGKLAKNLNRHFNEYMFDIMNH